MAEKAQVSMEYMVLVGFLMMVIIAFVLVSNQLQGDSKCAIVNQQIERIAKSIAQTAETIYYFGPPSRTEITIGMPRDIGDLEFGKTEVSYYVTIPYNCKTAQEYTQSIKGVVGGQVPAGEGNRVIKFEAKKVGQCPGGSCTLDYNTCTDPNTNVYSEDPNDIGTVFTCVDATP